MSADQKFTNALFGKNRTNDGMNTDEFKAKLLTIYPDDEEIIKKLNRRELEKHYMNKLIIEKSEAKAQQNITAAKYLQQPTTLKDLLIDNINGSAESSNSATEICTDYMEIIYRSKTFSRCVPQKLFAIQISAKNLKVPTVTAADLLEQVFPGTQVMENLESMLNSVKNTIDDIIKKDDKTYDRITDIIEYYKNLRTILKKEYHIVPMTNAWLKLYEMHNYFNLVKEADRITHFANADLPGTWIKATEYFIRQKYPNSYYEWRGSSLVPDVENKINALGDSYGLWQNNRNKWIMNINAGPNDADNGDTTRIANIHHMAAEIKKVSWTGVDMYTSDAGISVDFGTHESLAYNDQEQLNIRITFGALLAGLETLKIGGSFVEKLYTFFKPFTYSLIYLASNFFEKFYICKPLTSKATNSEIYLVGLKFRGISAEWREYLEEQLDKIKDVIPLPSPIIPTIDPDELAKIIEAAKTIYTRQAEMIKSNVEIYNEFKNNPGELEQLVEENRKKCEQKWIKTNLL